MRKFTLLFAFLLSLVGMTQAQTVVTDLNNLSNGKVYTLTGERGTLLTFEGATMLYGTFVGDKAGVAYDASDPYQQFAILKSDKGNQYLYNVGTGKFVLQSGNTNPLSDVPTQTLEVANAASPVNSYLWLLKVNGNMINFSQGHNNAGMCANYNTEDPGNRFCITEVGTFADEESVVTRINEYETWKDSNADWTTTTAPTLSTDDAPVYYSIKNLRRSKFAAWNSLGSPLKQTTDDTEAGAVWYFVDAKAAAGDVADGVIPVYIKNAASGLALTNATSMNYAETGTIFYLIKHTKEFEGYVICTASAISDNVRDCWCDENGDGRRVCYYMGDDSGSIWAFVPTSPGAVTSSKSKESALFESELASPKTAAIAEAEALGSRDYYAYADADVTECVNAINAVTASTYEEFVTAKTTTIPACVAALKAKTPTKNVLAGGEYIKFHWQRDTHYYLTTNATEATSEAAANATNLLGNQTATDARNIWQVVANSDKTGFYLYNPLSGKYVKHAAGAQLTLVADPAEASVYTFQAQNDYFWVTVGAGDENTDYLTLNNNGAAVGGKAVDNDNRANWYIEKPSDDEVTTLENLLATLSELQAQAIAAANTQIEGLNTGHEFYLYDTAKMEALKTTVAEKINAATIRAELAAAKTEVATLINDFINATDNRTNPLAAGAKVKFLNKEVNTNYMTTDANGATTSSEVTTASVWELVANNEATGYYLYNNLSGKYLKHAAQNGGQATLVAKTEATLYNVQPKGAYVVMGEVVPTSDRAYVHCDDPSNKITRYTEESDRSLWTVTSATDDEISQLTTDIQTNITTQLDAAVAAADAVVNPYKALEFYKPQAAINTYDADIAAATEGVDTYEELAAALEAIAAAKTAFETAVAADDVELSNIVGDGTRIKLLNRQHNTYMSVSTANYTVNTVAAADAGSVWTFKAAEGGGFYLLNPLTNKYVKHAGSDNTRFSLVASTEEASVYYVHPNGLYVTVGRLPELSKEESSRDYLHGVDWNAVVRWTATAEASHWTLASVTEDEVDALNAAISVEASAQWEAYKAKAQETVDAYAALPYFTATEAAVTAYNNAVAEIGEVVTYLGLSNGKAMLDEALNAFLATDRSASNNPFVNGARAKFVNRGNPTLWMTTNAQGVTADANVGLESHWVFVENDDQTGFYMYNESADKYVKHPAQNGQQAALVAKAEASVYNVVPNGLYVNVVVKTDEELSENCLHYGSEGYVTRWLDSHNASQWNFEIVSDEDFLALAVDTLAKYKELALQKVEGATKSYYYAPTQGAADVATAAIEAVNVESSEITSYAVFKERWAAIDAALSAMYEDGEENGREPTDGDRIRLRNKVYPTHYLGANHDGLSHYEVVEGEGGTAFNSVESTVWELEKDENIPGRFYLKNVMTLSYAEHPFYDSWQVQLVQNKNEAHTDSLKLVPNRTTADGELCFVVFTNEGTASKNNALHAVLNNNAVVNGARNADASMWIITEATFDEDSMTTYQAQAYHEYVFVPTIERAKRYYFKNGEDVVVDYIDDVKAGYYSPTGEDLQGLYDTTEEFEADFWEYISNAIALAEGAEEPGGGHQIEQAMMFVQALNAFMNTLQLNKPNRDGFFRIRCVHNDMYMQSEKHDSSKLKLNAETGMSSIFYLDTDESADGEGTLLSYKEGYYFTQGTGTQGYSGIYALLKGIGEKGDMFRFDIPANKEFGSYNISSDNTQTQNGRRYLFGAAGSAEGGYRLDNGGDATIVHVATDLSGSTGYNWVLERVDSLPVKINSYGYATFYAPIALCAPEGVEAQICTGWNEVTGDLTMETLAGGLIPAGTAVILKAEEFAGQEVYFTEPAANDIMPLLESENYLHGGVYKTWRKPECQNKNPEMTSATGTNANLPYLEEEVGDKVYTLANRNGKVAMYQYAGNKFTHFRAFLKVPAEVNANLAAVLNFGEIEEPTGIEEAPAISLEDAIIYDLSGRRVAEPGKGVYIVNGKKVYFK